jgi:hypothetical protein
MGAIGAVSSLVATTSRPMSGSLVCRPVRLSEPLPTPRDNGGRRGKSNQNAMSDPH